jgi:photosynthetic reaction center cytochrome c subunit
MRTAILRFLAGSLVIAGLAATPALSVPQASQPPNPPPAAAPQPTAQPSASAQRPLGLPELDAETATYNERALAEVQKAIAGKENQPAESVFKNIQSLKGAPAGRLPRVMDAFSHALGVSCKKCHDAQNWANDDKDEKKAARGMMAMTKDINDKYLKTIPGLDDKAVVNCTTCHRGHANPNEGLQGSRPPSPK